MIINKSGITIRLAVKDIRVTGRATQGVKLINLSKKQDEIASITKVNAEEEDEVDSNTEVMIPNSDETFDDNQSETLPENDTNE